MNKNRKIIGLKKEEFKVKEFIKKFYTKGKVSKVTLEYTPVGEKIIIFTDKIGLIIGKGGELIRNITEDIKKKFDLENPHIEVEEILQPALDAQLMADEIALSLERFGPLKFKVVAYRALQKMISAGAVGAEIRINGKVPSSRAKSWRFAQGYLKKTGDSAKVVRRAKTRAETKPGTVGIRVSIFPPGEIIKGKIEITEEMIISLKKNNKK